jgi:predicted RNase H-like HicB family nuclease
MESQIGVTQSRTRIRATVGNRGTDGRGRLPPVAPSGPYDRFMSFDDYKVVLYRQDDGSWVAEIPALGGCYALMDARQAALAELDEVFALIAQEHQERGIALPKDTTEIVCLARRRDANAALLSPKPVRRCSRLVTAVDGSIVLIPR